MFCFASRWRYATGTLTLLAISLPLGNAFAESPKEWPSLLAPCTTEAVAPADVELLLPARVVAASREKAAPLGLPAYKTPITASGLALTTATPAVFELLPPPPGPATSGDLNNDGVVDTRDIAWAHAKSNVLHAELNPLAIPETESASNPRLFPR